MQFILSILKKLYNHTISFCKVVQNIDISGEALHIIHWLLCSSIVNSTLKESLICLTFAKNKTGTLSRLTQYIVHNSQMFLTIILKLVKLRSNIKLPLKQLQDITTPVTTNFKTIQYYL